MTRDQARAHLDAGGELDCLVLNDAGLVLGRGPIRKTGSRLRAQRDGTGTRLQLSLNGDRLDTPLVHDMHVRQGEEIAVEFGANWQEQRRRA